MFGRPPYGWPPDVVRGQRLGDLNRFITRED